MWYIKGIGLNSYKMKGQGGSYRVFESRGKVLVEASRGDQFWVKYGRWEEAGSK